MQSIIKTFAIIAEKQKKKAWLLSFYPYSVQMLSNSKSQIRSSASSRRSALLPEHGQGFVGLCNYDANCPASAELDFKRSKQFMARRFWKIKHH